MQAMTIRMGKSQSVTRKHLKDGSMLRLGAGFTDLVGDPEVVLVVTVLEVTVRRVTTGLDSGLLCAW